MDGSGMPTEWSSQYPLVVLDLAINTYDDSQL